MLLSAVICQVTSVTHTCLFDQCVVRRDARADEHQRGWEREEGVVTSLNLALVLRLSGTKARFSDVMTLSSLFRFLGEANPPTGSHSSSIKPSSSCFSSVKRGNRDSRKSSSKYYEDAKRHRVKLIWLYCSHCAYCQCFHKVLLQWHLEAVLPHCMAAYQFASSMPEGGEGRRAVYLFTQQQARAHTHTLLSSSCNCKPLPPPHPHPLGMAVRLSPSLCGGDGYCGVLGIHGDKQKGTY